MTLTVNKANKAKKKHHFTTARIRFIALSVTTSIGIFLIESGFLGQIVLAEEDGGGGDGGEACLGFLCGVLNTITADPGFSAGSALFTTIFLGLNLLILIALVVIIVKVIGARDAGEEYQSLINKTVAAIIALFVVNYFAAFLFGI